MSAPRLFDHAVLHARVTRRQRLDTGADFLFRRCAEDLADRLAPMLRPFPDILVSGASTQAFTTVLKALRPQSTVHHATASTPDLLLGENGQPLPPESLDMIASVLSLQHANDLPGALIQIRRGLKPDGLFLGCLAGGATLTELRQCLTQAESDLTGAVSPRVFPFADVRDMGGLLQRAGLALPVADSESLIVRYDDIFALMADLRLMGATNILHERSRRFTRRAILLKAAEIYAHRFADADGRIRATFEIIWLTGWAPHESQQQPLKPGSAKQRLAAALGAIEHSSGDKPG